MNIYKISKDKFKSVYFSLSYISKVNEMENSQNALLSQVLSKGCSKYKNQIEIEKKLYSMYGANFDVSISKFGDLYMIEFRIEFINKKFLPDNTDMLMESIMFLNDIIYNPMLTNSKFDESIVKREKENLLDRISELKDDKEKYAIFRMENLLCPSDPFGMYIYGSDNIIPKISSGDLYKRYVSLVNNSCIIANFSGNLDGYENLEDKVKEVFGDKLDNNIGYEDLEYNKKSIEENNDNNIAQLEESLQTSQSIIAIGMRVKNTTNEDFFKLNVYNMILGVSPISKMFLNVREKHSLSYRVTSRYYRFKDILIAFAGIDKQNYEKAKNVMLTEINNMTSGKITKEELDAAKEGLIADLKEWDDSKIALSKLLVSNIVYYKDVNVTLEDYINSIESITLEEIIEVAKRVEVEKIFLLGGDLDV